MAQPTPQPLPLGSSGDGRLTIKSCDQCSMRTKDQCVACHGTMSIYVERRRPSSSASCLGHTATRPGAGPGAGGQQNLSGLAE